MSIINNKKRNIYVGVIAFCILAALGVLTFSKPSLPEVSLTPTTNNAPPAVLTQTGFGERLGAPSISVFPQNVNFDLTVFETNPRFKQFKEYEPIQVDPEKELGRDNPFVPYE